MKKTTLRLFLVTGVIAIAIMACQKAIEKGAEPSGEATVSLKEEQNTNAKVAACPAVYALVLTGSFGSPVPAGLQSFLYKVDLCTAPVSFAAVSQIRIGLTGVTDVTGICDMPGVANYAWAVTGINSNFPQKLLRVQISTGAATIVSTTTVPLQDIENYGNTGLFIAIREGTSQLMRVTVPGGACVAFAPAGPTNQYNGITVVGNKFHVISGITNFICSPNSGDVFEYNLGGGPYVAKYSYKNLPGNGTWTMKELGFYFDSCCGKRWVVGSSSNVLSHNVNITPCVVPNPAFLLNTRAIYDFLAKP